MAETESSDDKLVKEAKSLLGGHVKYFSAYEDHANTALAKYISPDKTVGELIKNGTMGKVMNDLLEKYLGIVGIKGDMAKEYLRDLTLTDQELKDLFKGQMDKKYSLEVASEIKRQVRNKLHAKLQETIDAKIQNMGDVDKIKDFVDWFHKEAGTDYAFPGRKKDIKTARDGLEMYRRAFGNYVSKQDEMASYKKAA